MIIEIELISEKTLALSYDVSHLLFDYTKIIEIMKEQLKKLKGYTYKWAGQ
jgi:hypothetical protein